MGSSAPAEDCFPRWTHRTRMLEHIRRELVECAKMVSQLDARMLALNEEIQSLEKEKETEAAGE